MSSSTSSEESVLSESSSSNGAANDAKMRAMLSEWDTKEASENHDVYVDSDSDIDDEEDATKRMALLKAGENNHIEDEIESESEDEEDEDEVEVEDASDDEDEEEEGEEEEDVAMPTSVVVNKEIEEVQNKDTHMHTVEDESDLEEEDIPQATVEDESEEEETEEEDEESDAEEYYEEEEEEEVEDDEAVVDKVDLPVAKSMPDQSRGIDDDEEDVIDDGNIEDTLKKKPKKKKEKKKLAPITAVTSNDTEEDAAMKALLSQWGGDEGDEDEDDDSDDDEDSEASEREVQLEDNVIDHIVLAAPDLDEAMASFEKMTGISPVVAGSINGLGIKSARISFNDSSYIEIIAPDPKQAGPIGQLLKSKGITELTPFHFAIRSSRAEQLKDEVKKFGYVPDHISMFGGQKDGVPRKWEMLYLYGHKIGGICPFFINWSNSDHPCATLPVVGKLKKFTIRAPKDDPVHMLMEHVAVKGFNIETGKTKLSFQFSSPEGTIKFATSKAVGFKFPGFDDEENDLEAGASDDDDVIFDNPSTPDLLDVGENEYEALPPPVY